MLVLSALAFAQPPADPLTNLQQAAEKKTAEWDGLARTLESKVARMLPCDARVRASIEEVKSASETRLAALSQYLEAAKAQAHADALTVGQALAQQEIAAREVEIDRAEAEQERIAVDAQLNDLAESVKRRAQLAEPRTALETISGLIQQRTATAQQQVARRAALTGALRDLSAAYQAREKAIQTEIEALATESSRWTDYYTARIARSQTECSITTQTPAQRQPQRKKK